MLIILKETKSTFYKQQTDVAAAAILLEFIPHLQLTFQDSYPMYATIY